MAKNRFRTKKLLYGEGDEAFPYWEVQEDAQREGSYFRRTGLDLPHSCHYEAQRAYATTRRLNRRGERA